MTDTDNATAATDAPLVLPCWACLKDCPVSSSCPTTAITDEEPASISRNDRAKHPNLATPVSPAMASQKMPKCLALSINYYICVQNYYELAHEWYANRKNILSRRSKILKFLSLFFGSFGAIIPISSPLITYFKKSADINSAFPLDSFGYVFLAISGALVYYDKMFGDSTGWVRCINTMNQLKTLATRHEEQWMQIRVSLECQTQQDLTPDNRLFFLQQAKEIVKIATQFKNDILVCMHQETQTWIEEFQSNLAHLQRKADEALTRGAQTTPAQTTQTQTTPTTK
ncbi:MAG: SLATT domain-containing protein [Magnetococcales bacterium]|nr:SLATT domain-containing protein [Magnetococcales bacterium]